MTNLSKWAAICAVTALMLFLTNGTVVAQDAKVFEGTLMAVDPNAKILTLKEGDQQMQFTYTEQTELVTPEKDGQPVAVRQGSRLRIQYKESNNVNVAMRIEVTQV